MCIIYEDVYLITKISYLSLYINEAFFFSCIVVCCCHFYIRNVKCKFYYCKQLTVIADTKFSQVMVEVFQCSCILSTCIFCGEKNDSFTEEGLDLHYWKNCPMLKRCANCKQVIVKHAFFFSVWFTIADTHCLICSSEFAHQLDMKLIHLFGL